MAGGNISIYLLAGMKVVITVPHNTFLGEGWFPKKGQIQFKDGTVFLQNGFWVEDTDVGEIVEVSPDALAITYHHKRAEKNTIWFKAATGETGVVSIVAVPIHDHSSIVQGGPSYGTYFSDDSLAT